MFSRSSSAGYAVRVEESTEVYADAGRDGRHRPHRAVHDDVGDRPRSSSTACARRSRRAPGSPAGTAASPTPTARRRTTCSWSAGSSPPTRARSPAVRRRPGGQLPALHGERSPSWAGSIRSPRASTTSTWRPSSTGCSTTTSSTCWPPRRTRSGRGIRGTGRSSRRRSGPGCGAPGRIVVTTPGHSLDVLENPTSVPSSRGACCGRPARRRHRRSGGHLPAYLDTLAHHPRVRIAAVADLDASRAAAVAAELPGARAVSVDRLLDSPDVRTVLNLTIPAAHAEIALARDRRTASTSTARSRSPPPSRAARSIVDRAAAAGAWWVARRTPCSARARRPRGPRSTPA